MSAVILQQGAWVTRSYSGRPCHCDCRAYDQGQQVGWWPCQADSAAQLVVNTVKLRWEMSTWHEQEFARNCKELDSVLWMS